MPNYAINNFKLTSKRPKKNFFSKKIIFIVPLPIVWLEDACELNKIQDLNWAL